jgi:glutamate racemase
MSDFAWQALTVIASGVIGVVGTWVTIRERILRLEIDNKHTKDTVNRIEETLRDHLNEPILRSSRRRNLQ